MVDIEFYMKMAEIKKDMKNDIILSEETMENAVINNRSSFPILYQIETTNICNMKCVMCPRGNGKMTRQNETMPVELFEKIISQITPWNHLELMRWDEFCRTYYNINESEMSENHFFCNVIAKCLTLHGWGDPLLDRTIVDKLAICKEHSIPTYFSCNPSNIKITKLIDIMNAGLTYLKFSIDAIDDTEIKTIRGSNATFNESYKNIVRLLALKDEQDLKTTVVITMINIDGQKQDEYHHLMDLFAPYNVYIYLKSENTQWLKHQQRENKSIHWSEFCQFPWSSMAILANGDCVICSEDYNGEITLGNVKEQSLLALWNGKKINQIRYEHIYGGNAIGRCQRCDMKAFYKW